MLHVCYYVKPLTHIVCTGDEHSHGMESSKSTEQIQEPEEMKEEEENVSAGPLFLAFARIYSGTLKRGQELFVLQPRYDPHIALQQTFSSLPPHTSSFVVQDLFLLMGREVIPIDSSPAGSVVGIGGLEELVYKSATLSSSLSCPAFRQMSFAASPIVRVAIEPEHVVDMPALVRGMKLLNQADPCVEVTVIETGEHVLATAGEIHLQRCIDDLRERFACVNLKVSAPIIPFRETVVLPPRVDMVNELISNENEVKFVSNPHPQWVKEGDMNAESAQSSSSSITIFTADRTCSLQLEVSPLPDGVVKILESNSHLLRVLADFQTAASREEIHQFDTDTITKLKQLKKDLDTAFSTGSDSLQGVVDRIWAFGPRGVGPNVLLNSIDSYHRPSLWSTLESSTARAPLREYDNSIVSGFQLASLSGPLCEEPMHGVCFALSSWTSDCRNPGITSSNVPQDSTYEKVGSERSTGHGGMEGVATYGPLSGQLMSAMKEACRRAFLAQPARLMAAMYTCDIRATAEVLGRVYAVLGRRSGRCINNIIIKAPKVLMFGWNMDTQTLALA